jgi:hypothetical protein
MAAMPQANIQWVQETRDRSPAMIARHPWLIIAGGMLLGCCLSRQGEAQHPHATLALYAATRQPLGIRLSAHWRDMGAE